MHDHRLSSALWILPLLNIGGEGVNFFDPRLRHKGPLLRSVARRHHHQQQLLYIMRKNSRTTELAKSTPGRSSS